MMMHTLCSILMLVVVSVNCQTAPTVKIDLPKTISRSFEGVNYTLTCDFNGDPTPEITWLRNGFVHIASDRFVFTDNNRKMEMINTEHLIHNGLYQCEGKNSAGAIRSSAVTYRTIYWGKDFAIKSDHQSFSDVDGDRFVRLECAPPVGDPPFEHNGGNFFWFKDDESINEKLYTRLLVRDNAGFIIDWLEFNATKAHVGVYTCIYVIEDQYRVHSMNLTVFDGPPRPQKFTLSKGSRTKNSLTMKWVKPTTPVDKYEMVIKLLFSNHGDPDRTVIISADKESVRVENLRSSFVYEFTINSIKDGIKSLPTAVKVQVLADPATLPATTTTTTAVQPTTVSKATKETNTTSTTTESASSSTNNDEGIAGGVVATIIIGVFVVILLVAVGVVIYMKRQKVLA